MSSDNYRELHPNELEHYASMYAESWKNPAIPPQQYEVIKREVPSWLAGQSCAPFDAFITTLEALKGVYKFEKGKKMKVLDVGGGAGHYGELLRQTKWGQYFDYTSMDYSAGFEELAKQIYPNQKFQRGDALNVPFPDNSFGMVMSGGMIMHIGNYRQAIAEAARVTSQWVLFHRTPVMERQPTAHFVKTAYGVPCYETHFNENELLGIFEEHKLAWIDDNDVFWDESLDFGHRNYLLMKVPE